MALLNQSTPLLHYMPTGNENMFLFLGIDCAVFDPCFVFGNRNLFPFPIFGVWKRKRDSISRDSV
jgi:hypothetical protein